jgi:spermidine dehydrogenase
MTDITRRDFLNGVALSIATGITPAAQIAAQPMRYPPALTGLRGQNAGSFDVAHALRDGAGFAVDAAPIEESYDLVVVGGGISGLATAFFYRRERPQARILILDAHDDFGGHARRNEFRPGGRLLIGYGGSESIQSPATLWHEDAKGLLHDLGVAVSHFETAFDRNFYNSLGLSRGLFFARESFGRDVLVEGDGPSFEGDDSTRRAANAKPLEDFVAGFPVSQASKAQLIALYDKSRDPLAGLTIARKLTLLKTTSYRDYLTRHCGLSEEAANCFQGRTLGFFGLGCDAVPAADARDLGYPGFEGLGLPARNAEEWKEPYIYHFPDGNASLARLLVRALVADAAPGGGMEDVVLAPFDYGRLDASGSRVRIRLDSTCVHVGESAGKASVGYVRGGAVHRVEAAHVVLACYHMMIPYLMPELPAPQRAALAKNVKTPIVYTNVVVRDWRPWIALKIHDISAPMSFHSRVKLDFPVSLGGYEHSRGPDEPICLHLVHVPGAPMQGLDARSQFRLGREKLFRMTFADFEDKIRDELDRMLGAGGFSSGRDIAAITVNRWAHGYGYVENSLFDGDNYEDVLKLARHKAGRVAIANSDAGGDAYAHLAIEHAARAVRELLA